MSKIAVKICGVKTDAAMDAALDAGADYVGFVFYPPSPRAILPEAAAPLAEAAFRRAKRVGLVVDATDIEIAAILAHADLDLLQLHGKETPARARQIRDRFGLRTIKAVSVATRPEVEAAEADYGSSADILLFDAKPPKRADALPGGNAVSFDWTIMTPTPAVPWMLSGGLTPETVPDAVKAARPPALDVSSGVERERGEKDPDLIHAFLAAVRQAQTQ